MRLLTTLLIIFVAVVALGFWTNHQLTVSANELLLDVDKIRGEINAENWDSASEHTEALERNWDRRGKWWPALLDHEEIDNIDFAIAKNKEYIAERNTPLALGQLSEIRQMIKHIPEKGTINLTNIF
ncbi:hypothetical protein Psch_03581 [Pelotomaculum schinkii]|uniref:DUF4363 domain-containing protein n=1 Tax=Pelotomaculum schinkii TaxID=78350 RepID=A0A4Y7R7X3_9FIRM|nr:MULTISPECIES: DUF4363 family protein [Pelotomaculum]TEB04819.1 hypothetical protein Psch_03581 [Pelotomaculum schinkii]TEB13998.1 hypothetical protein Psfp_03268 [Pelotomaculum sp. FP]